MKTHGMATDLQEIQRFNFVLMSRSIDQGEEAKELEPMGQVPAQQFQSLDPPCIQSTAPNTGKKKFMLPYQRRMRSASPPALQICTENYIVYS